MTNHSFDTYRPDIDGLRALAVIIVMLFHVGFDSFSGGFVSLDIFFVVSGFLITGIILKGIDAGRFSFKQFYTRRIRRLMPAYVLITFLSVIPAWFILIPSDFIYHTRMMGLALLSLSNFYIANTTGGYFDASAETIPLLHTWSLAVEEQFYLLWPITLLAILKLPTLRQRKLLMLIGLVVFTPLAQWYATYDAIRGYYLLPARIMEFWLGCTLALFYADLPRLQTARAGSIGAGGLALILFPLLWISKDDIYPGYYALFACGGTALMIYAGAVPNPVTRLFCWRPLVWIGQISYSLYLVHWIIMSFGFYLLGELSTGHKLAALALSFVLGALSKHLVEDRFRFGVLWSFRRTLLTFVIAPIIAMATLIGVTDRQDGFISRFADRADAIRALESKPMPLPEDCDPARNDCGVLLFGDSHAQHFSDFIHALAADAGLPLALKWSPQCQPLKGIEGFEARDRNRYFPVCEEMKRAAFADLNKFRVVVLGGYWQVSAVADKEFFYLSAGDREPRVENNRRLLQQGLEQTVEAILAGGAIPMLIRDLPTLKHTEFSCALRRILINAEAQCALDAAAVQADQRIGDEVLDAVARRYPQVVIIDPRQLLCDDQRCVTAIDELMLYRDDDHLNGVSSAMLGERYLRRFGNPLRAAAARTPATDTDETRLAPMSPSTDDDAMTPLRDTLTQP